MSCVLARFDYSFFGGETSVALNHSSGEALFMFQLLFFWGDCAERA